MKSKEAEDVVIVLLYFLKWKPMKDLWDFSLLNMYYCSVIKVLYPIT